MSKPSHIIELVNNFRVAVAAQAQAQDTQPSGLDLDLDLAAAPTEVDIDLGAELDLDLSSDQATPQAVVMFAPAEVNAVKSILAGVNELIADPNMHYTAYVSSSTPDVAAIAISQDERIVLKVLKVQDATMPEPAYALMDRVKAPVYYEDRIKECPDIMTTLTMVNGKLMQRLEHPEQAIPRGAMMTF